MQCCPTEQTPELRNKISEISFLQKISFCCEEKFHFLCLTIHHGLRVQQATNNQVPIRQKKTSKFETRYSLEKN